MPPATIYNKETIIKAAVQLIADKGLDHFSARNLSKVMKCSVQPIYSNFSDISELLDAVLEEIKKKILDYTKYPHAEFVFRSMGLGFTFFARDYPNLFTAFFHSNQQNQKFIADFLGNLRRDLDKDHRFDTLSGEAKDSLLEVMWIFTYGYANLIVKGIIKETSDEAISKMVIEVGQVMIKDALVGGK